MSVIDALSSDNVVFRGFITWSGILLLKVLLMIFLTIFQRFTKGDDSAKTESLPGPQPEATPGPAQIAVDNPEDVLREGTEIKKDEDVERVRRAHLNDLENAIPFVIIGFFYVLTEPNPVAALVLIRIAVIARILHTVVYAIYPVRQPARAICFFTTLFITLYMLFATIVHFFQI